MRFTGEGHCAATQFSWTAAARLSRVVPRQGHSIRITVRVGMRQDNLASAARELGRGSSEAPVGSPLIEVVAGSRERPALAALLPDFTIGSRGQMAAAGRVSGVVAWSRSRHQTLAKRRAAALEAPCLLLGTGLLRAPPAWAGAALTLSATANSMTGPSSPADFLDPCRLLLTHGWESPELLVRAADARRAIASRRLGGPWWNLGMNLGLPRRGNFLLLIASESGGFGANGAPSAAVLAAMLNAALVEYRPRQVVILAPEMDRRSGPRARFLSDATARGCTVITGTIDPWQAVERAACVYAAGGETGFLALLAGNNVRCFADSFYSGWGVTTDEAISPQKP